MIKKVLCICMCLIGSIIFYAKAEDDADARRQTYIREFLSYYQSAYQQKKIKFISDFFSPDALIITETKELIPIGNEIIPNSTKNRPYHSVIENRREYITRLNEYFKDHDKITLGMSNIIIRKHPKYPEIYGVNFTQMWDDDGDGTMIEKGMPGYIFLMIDFRQNENEPTVHVRTWQPKSNITAPSDKYTLSDFRIISAK